MYPRHPRRRCGSHCKHLGWRSQKLKGFGPQRDRCREPFLHTGGGEATSNSAPFMGRIHFFASQLTHSGHLAPCRSVSDHFHQRHHGRLSGAVSAFWAVCSRTWSCWTSTRRASSSWAWAWIWACSVVTKASVLPSWLLSGWSLGSNSISHRYPWGVGSRWASSSPLLMRRRIVSVDTPKRRAASPIDTFSTTFLPLGMGNSIGGCLGNRLGAAWASSGRILPGPAIYRDAIDHLPAAAPVCELLSAVDLRGSPWIQGFRPISKEITHSAPTAADPKGRRAAELFPLPVCPPSHRRNTAGRRAGAGPPHLLSGGLNVHVYIW